MTVLNKKVISLKKPMKTFPYDKKYFLSECDGYVQFKNSKGKVLGKRLKKIFELAGI